MEKNVGCSTTVDIRSFGQSHDETTFSRKRELIITLDVFDIRTAILDCLERADGGKAVKAALEQRGLMLANGDRRDCFVVVDQAGGQ
ncbi:MAG TPA: hypothetical protein VL614_10150, partial [Acetobacteraceae bacterium]|nr:hypothetical protein [Acetobacteraceae bacterium]